MFSEPDVYDIVVFRGAEDSSVLYVKRIIGLPGDEVNIVNGQVFINGSHIPQRSDFVHGALVGNFGPYIVPEDHFFVLGDNRVSSVDSRHWRSSYVSRDQILGRAIFRYFPGFRNLTNT
jgi:signal peptidase I